MARRESHIVLIGFMGSGKSTVGKMLAEHLKLPFIDTDEEIVKQEQMSISEIFDKKGEVYFRRTENQMLLSILKSDEMSVIATGGGAPCFHNGIDLIKKYSQSFYLKVGKQRLLERIFGDKSRPLVAQRTKRELKEFIDVSLREREPFYSQANYIILAYNTPDRIVARIIKHLN